MSDNTLTTLMGNVPSRFVFVYVNIVAEMGARVHVLMSPLNRCILLLEDLDAAFTRGISRDESSTGVPTTTTATATATAKAKEESDGSTLSLSGLLNSLDGVAAAEGR